MRYGHAVLGAALDVHQVEVQKPVIKERKTIITLYERVRNNFSRFNDLVFYLLFRSQISCQSYIMYATV